MPKAQKSLYLKPLFAINDLNCQRNWW